MPEPTLDQLLSALESDLSEARGHILRLEDVVGGYKIEVRLLKETIRANELELAELRAVVNRLAPQRPERRVASPPRTVIGAMFGKLNGSGRNE